MRSEEVQDLFPQTRNALTKRYKQTYMFVRLTRKPSYGLLRSHISKSSRMETSDLLHVAGRGWRNTLPPRGLCRQGKISPWRNGFLRWDFHRALWGESMLQKTLKLCRERPTGIYGKSQTQQGGCASQRPVGLSPLKYGRTGVHAPHL